MFNLKDRIANINKCLSWSSSEANGIVQKKYNFDPKASKMSLLRLFILMKLMSISYPTLKTIGLMK